MNQSQLVTLLKQDLQKEYQHMLFYLNASCYIQGPFREELGEFFEKEALDEMNHVKAFTKLIIELDDNDDFLKEYLNLNVDVWIYSDVKNILSHILKMEEEVVERYVQRIKDAETLETVNGKFVELFLEDQILDSKNTVMHVRQMLEKM